MVKKQGTISAFFRPQGPQREAPEPKAPEHGRAKDALPSERGAETRFSRMGGRERQTQRVRPDPPADRGSPGRATPAGAAAVASRKRSAEEGPKEVPEEVPEEVPAPPRDDGSDTVLSSVDGDAPPAAATPDRAAARRKLLAEGGDCLDDSNSEAMTPEKEWSQRNAWTVDIRDRHGRPESDPQYDPSSLRIPASAYGRLTPFQKQFWDIKSEHFDVLLMFKKGKFYEMYDRDADIGARVLNLNYTGGGRVDMRCVGVPEQALSKHLTSLVEAGYKVGRVDQVETTNAAKKRRTSSSPFAKSQICKRVLVKIVTKGTLTDESHVSEHEARWVLAIKEDAGASPARIGVCYVDASSGAVHLDEFDDDDRRNWLETLMALVRPAEVVVDVMDSPSERLDEMLRFYRGQGTEISKAVGGAPDLDGVPDHVRDYLSDGNAVAAAAFALGRRYFDYLRIGRDIFSMSNYRIHEQATDADRRMVLDAATLSNLELLRSNFDGSETGALVSFVDRAITPGGKRTLRAWVARPLLSAGAINDRLDAVDALAALVEEPGRFEPVRQLLAAVPDLERNLAKVHAIAIAEENVVMFDDSNKRKVTDFVGVLKGIQAGLRLAEHLQGELLGASGGDDREPPSALVRLLADVPADLAGELSWFMNDALNFPAAERGEVKPLRGESADEEYSAAAREVQRLEERLQTQLEGLRERLGEPRLEFFHRGKEGYQVDVPKAWLSRNTLPVEFESLSSSAQSERFWTPRIRELFYRKVEAQEALELQEGTFFRRVLARFDSRYHGWSRVVRAVSELDALLSLAVVSRRNTVPMCRPTVLGGRRGEPVLELEQSLHPMVANRMNYDLTGHFVPNDVALGGDHEPVALVTGPNMGGKSTILRQTCLAVVLAQVGCYVPASKCTLTPVDRIFTRIGAHDRITRGQSTFMVEMEETSELLRCATRRSLLILDELGRGTSTFDGYAIADVVLAEIADRGCRTMFSTHYHLLSEQFRAHPKIAQYEMAAKVDEVKKEVTFLYRFVRGVAPMSRGIFCARVARVPLEVVEAAERHAELLRDSVHGRVRDSAPARLFRSVLSACERPPSDAGAELQLLQERAVACWEGEEPVA